jgi:biopolymer transport protein TolQ
MEVETVQNVAQGAGQLSLWHLIWNAGFVVQLVMLGLAAASVWSWAIIFEKFFVYRRTMAQSEQFEQNFWSGQSLEDLYMALGSRNNSGLAAIFMSAMREWKRSFESQSRSALQGVCRCASTRS